MYVMCMGLWFTSYIVSRLSDSTQLQQATSEVQNVHACVEEG